MTKWKQGDVIEHYKGSVYFILGFATHTEDEETLVLYCSYEHIHLSNPTKIWARPQSMFDDMIEGKPRFRLIPPGFVTVISGNKG